MPNLTPIEYREGYQLYEGKPGLAEDSSKSLQALDRMVRGTGEEIGYGNAGDSPHFLNRIKKTNG